MMTMDSGCTFRRAWTHRSSLSFSVGAYPSERACHSQSAVAAITTIVITTVTPRHGAGGIGRSNSSGGPPWICSSRVSLRKNIRGNRSRCLKLEINEGITGSLSENDGERHDRADRGDGPCRQPDDGGFKTFVAHRPMHPHHAGGDDRDLKQLARGQNHVAARMAAEHSA